jgi:phage pi2 protein 07
MNELQYGESIEVECKKASNSLPKSVWETYSSFSTGVLYFPRKSGKKKSFRMKKIMKSLIRMISQRSFPSLMLRKPSR